MYVSGIGLRTGRISQWVESVAYNL